MKRKIITAHPTIKEDERILRKENQILPFGKVHGRSSNIGAFIDLKMVPKMLYIHIKRGAPEYAFDVLVKRLIEHARESPTRILKKQSKKGKFSYRTWISTKIMSTITEQQLADKLIKLTKNRTISSTIVVRQKMKSFGHVHSVWEENFSLLWWINIKDANCLFEFGNLMEYSRIKNGGDTGTRISECRWTDQLSHK